MTEKRLVVRADCAPGVGLGHVLRTTAIAQELHRRGWQVSLASSGVPSGVGARLAASGIRLIELPPAEASGFGPAQELDFIASAVGAPVTWIALDHYALGASWLTEAKRTGAQRLVIDDLHDRPLPCELLVNPGPTAAEGHYRAFAPNAELLLGPRYVLLRREFRRALPRAAKRRFGKIHRVLIAMGGTDPQGATALMARAVRRALPDAELDVVLGSFASPEPEPDALGAARIWRDLADLTPLMVDADLAVGAGGGMTWERCALGLPALVVAVAPNQREQAEAVADSGACEYLGDISSVSPARLWQGLARLAEPERRERMSAAGRTLVDGRGAIRVADHMEGVSLRLATVGDMRAVWEMANDRLTRAQSFSSDPIPWADHRAWFQRRLIDATHPFLIAENGAGVIGYVRFDQPHRNDPSVGAEVSIALDAEHRGGLGRKVLEAACVWWDANSPGPLQARIKTDNASSRHVFAAAGFQEMAAEAGVVALLRLPIEPNGRG